MKKRLTAMIIALISVFAASAVLYNLSSNTITAYSKDFFALDTYISLKINAEKSKEYEIMSILENCESYTRHLEEMLSHTIENSDVSEINRHAGDGVFVQVSEETRDILLLSQEISKASDGAFDITVLSLVDLWDIKNENPKVPDKDDISAALALVGIESLVYDAEHQAFRLEKPLQKITLGAVAKGYIADKLKELMIERGVKSAIINLGGNTVAIGTKPDNTAWSVGVQHPENTGSILGKLYVTDKAVVTSGDYERYFEKDGVRYHHIINPKTGYPSDNELRSVTVIGENSAVCDALSTACFILGKEKSTELLEKYNYSAVFCDKSMRVSVVGDVRFEEVE